MDPWQGSSSLYEAVSRQNLATVRLDLATDLAPEVIKLFFMINLTEHKISTAHKN